MYINVNNNNYHTLSDFTIAKLALADKKKL